MIDMRCPCCGNINPVDFDAKYNNDGAVQIECSACGASSPLSNTPEGAMVLWWRNMDSAIARAETAEDQLARMINERNALKATINLVWSEIPAEFYGGDPAEPERAVKKLAQALEQSKQRQIHQHCRYHEDVETDPQKYWACPECATEMYRAIRRIVSTRRYPEALQENIDRADRLTRRDDEGEE